MSVTKELGKISRASFGFGGYQDAQFGLSLEFAGEGWGCGTFAGWWADRSELAKWGEGERMIIWSDMNLKIIRWLREAKVNDVSKLVGVPVEITFEDRMLKSWRILKEVL